MVNEWQREFDKNIENLTRLHTFINKKINPPQIAAAKEHIKKIKQRQIYLYLMIQSHDFLL